MPDSHQIPEVSLSSSTGPFAGAGRNIRQILRSPVSWVFVGVILVIQMVVTLGGGPDAWVPLFLNFGLSRDGFLSGKIWQMVSYGFLHGGWGHVGLNAVFLLVIGSRIEHIGGRVTMLVALFAGILGGGLGHLLLGSGLLVGISGACFALLLLLTTLSPESRMFPLPVSGRNLGIGVLLTALLLTLVNPTFKLPGFSGIGEILIEQGLDSLFQISHACHLGGGLAGWLYGRWILRPRVTLDRLRRERARREAN